MTTTVLPELALHEYVARHALRGMILRQVAEHGERAPVDIHRDLDVRLGTVAYHVRALADRGALQLVATAKRRGAVEHRYSLTAAGRTVVTPAAALEVAVTALRRITVGDADPGDVERVIADADMADTEALLDLADAAHRAGMTAARGIARAALDDIERMS